MGKLILEAGASGGKLGDTVDNKATTNVNGGNVIMEAGMSGGVVQNKKIMTENIFSDIRASRNRLNYVTNSKGETVIPNTDPVIKAQKETEQRDFLLSSPISASYNHEYAAAKADAKESEPYITEYTTAIAALKENNAKASADIVNQGQVGALMAPDSMAGIGVYNYFNARKLAKLDTKPYEITSKWTQEQKNRLASEYRENGLEAAKKFAKEVNSAIEMDEVRETSGNNAFNAIAASVVSVPLKLASGLDHGVNMLEYGVGKVLGQNVELESNYGSEYSSALRAGVSDAVDIEIAGWDAFDFVYNTVMSGADSLVVAPAGWAGALTLGLSAAADTTNDILKRGGTSSQAFWGGLVAGTFESLFEKLSIGNLQAFKEIAETSLKSVVKNIGKSMLVNASEEGLTEIANILYDTIVNTDISNYTNLVSQYQDEGYSLGKAQFKAACSLGLQVVEAAASGALMGFGFGVLGGGVSRHNASSIGKIIVDNNSQDSVIQVGLSMDKNSESYKMAKKLQNGNKTSNASLGGLATQILADASTQKGNTIKNFLETRATQMNFKPSEVKAAVDFFVKAASNQKISTLELRTISQNNFANSVKEDYTSNAEWVNNMKVELSQVESVETQVREAITLKESQNPVLQSSANGENAQPEGVSGGLSGTNGTNIGTSGNISETNDTFSGTVAAKNNNTAVNGVIDESRVIDLSNDNELAQLLGDMTGAPKYNKIRDYVLGLLGGQKITLSDGKNAIVDKSDALHIANKAARKKISQISKIKEIIEKAELYAEDNNVEHNKFNYFCYYRAFVRVGKDIVPVYLNVGKGINDGKYHIYDITNKIRDTAHRINGVERPKPNEGYALQTVSHDYTVPQEGTEVNSSISDNGENYSDSPENHSDNDSGEMGFREPDSKSIYRKSTDEETAEGILTGKRLDNKMRHINDIAKKLDSGLKIIWCEKNSDKLHGKNGKYVRETNTIYLAKDIGIAQMYHEVFKHEFVHRLESKKAYQAFEKYLFEKSVAFENYARAQLKVIYPNENFETRDDVFENLIEDYYHRVESDTTIPANIRKSFTWADAKREIVADFVGETLFKGKENIQDLAQALSDADIDSVKDMQSDLDLFGEMATDNRTLLQKVIDAIKDFINNLKHVPQNKSLVEDLEYIEQRLSRVYASKDTKKAADMAPNVQFSFGDANSSESRFIIETINDNISAISNESVFSVEGEQIPDELKKSEYVLNIFETQGKMAFNSKLGKVELVQSGAKSTVFHGFGAEKLAATKAIKDVIEKGNIIQTTENYNNTGVDRYVMAAKGIIDGKPAYVGLIIKTYPKQKNQNAKFYLHEAIIIETDSPIMTAPQLSVDTVSESVPTNKIPHIEDSVKNNISEESENYSDISDIKEQFSLGSPAQQARENRQKYDSGEITLEEYLKTNDELWGKSNEEFGALPQGENAQAPIATPKAVAEDKPTERFTRTIIETGKLSDEMLQGMEEKVLLGDFAYTVISDEAATKKAEAAVNNGTAEDIWTDAVNDGKRFNKNQLAIGEQLLADAIKNGDTKRVLELSAELADAFTRAGQIVQAARLLKKMTGAGRLVSAQRMVRTINKDLRQKYGEDRAPIKISDAAAKRLVNAKTENGIQHAYDEVLKEVAEQMPVTFLDKWNAWRYFAMLSNPKTHIRNVVGNLIFVPAFRIRYAMAVGMEQAAVKTGIIKADSATKSLIIKKEYTNFAKKDGKSKEVVQLLKGNKYNDKTAIKEKQRIFKNEVLEFLTTFNSNALEAEDMLFKNKHYIHALAGYLQAKDVDLNNVSEDVLAEARIYAVNEARKATFNDESALANWVQNFGNKNIATNMAVEGVLPFKRTPINIVKRGIEYSPIGLAKTLTKGVFDIKKGKITPTEFIDGLASGFTGTGIMLAGMFLASLGCISGGEDDDDLSAFEKLLGKQEYAVEIFGNSYTIDWAAPSVIPFFIGAEIVNTINAGEDFSISQIGNAVWNSLEPITNLSMLSGLQGVIESGRYAEPSQILASIAGDALTSYAMQVIPSLSGAVSRTIDPKQRSWYVDKNDKVFDAFSQTLANNVASKIPGLSYLQIPKIDAWGREVSRGNVGERVAENFVSPGYYSKVEYDEVSEELKRIFVETGAKVFPKTAAKSFQVNGETKQLTADEYVTYAKAKGEYAFDYIYEFVNSSVYKRLGDGERAEVIENLYEYANAKAKTTVSDYDLNKQYKTVTNREKNGGSAIDYYVYLAIKKK